MVEQPDHMEAIGNDLGVGEVPLNDLTVGIR